MRHPIRFGSVALSSTLSFMGTAAEVIHQLGTELSTRGVELAFAEMKDSVKNRLHRYGLKAEIGHEFFFPTVGVAVKAFIDLHPPPGRLGRLGRGLDRRR